MESCVSTAWKLLYVHGEHLAKHIITFSALITAAQAELFICSNVLIEDYGSDQCDTRDNMASQRGGAGKYWIAAETGDEM